MCGIAGIIQSSPGAYVQDDVRKMNASLTHRGPDGEGYWQNDDASALLGHRRLAIIDLTEQAAQPFHYLGRYSVVHNGEIYNYIELKAELAASGYSFRTHSDTEVLVAAYDHWKEACTEHFDGMFAFAIWDEKEKQLFAARDRFGEKPFFYHYKDDVLLFASEMKALWAAGVPRVPNRNMLFNFLTIGYTGNPEAPDETFFEDIHKLPPASFLACSIKDNIIETGKYWELDPEITNKKIKDAEAIDQFRHLLSVSVQRRMRSDVTLGTSLSGGIDSSAIAAMCRGFSEGGGLHKAFTAVFPGFEKDESGYADIAAKHLQLEPFTVSANAAELARDWLKMSACQEEPVGSASSFAQYRVYEKARQQGVTVMLDGQGADEILAGYTRYYKWYWQELFRKGKLYGHHELRSARALGVTEKFGIKNMIASFFPEFATVALERQYLLRALQQEDLSKFFVQHYSSEAYYTTPDHFTLNGVLHFSTCINGLEELLRYADRNAMAHGVEVRLPFLSHELVEFIFSLPSHFKIRDGRNKWLLRESMRPLLPESITHRTDKVGFEPPQQQWMEDPEIREMIRDARKKLTEEGILKPQAAETMPRAHSAHDTDPYDWRYFSAAQLFS